MLSEQTVLGLEKVSELGLLRTDDFFGRMMTVKEFAHLARLLGAFWRYPGTPHPERPHALLTSGRHSNGFINCGVVLSYANLCAIMAAELLKKLRSQEPCWQLVNWVVGLDHAAAALVASVADQLTLTHAIRFDFCEKGPDGAQLWRRHQIPGDAVVLQVEELLTTAKTAEAVRRGIREGNGGPVNFAPRVAVLVNRSSVREVDGRSVLSVFEFNIDDWDPTRCPLCAEGSVAIRPKDNWDRLTRRG